mmetsp:Transcript_38499/g.106258  ORF Transcript_38499/g.106258 Transcript_38499/m.106258 type:complete len:432 (-) Transcript_38499:943-2238(-)
MFLSLSRSSSTGRASGVLPDQLSRAAASGSTTNPHSRLGVLVSPFAVKRSSESSERVCSFSIAARKSSSGTPICPSRPPKKVKRSLKWRVMAFGSCMNLLCSSAAVASASASCCRLGQSATASSLARPRSRSASCALDAPPRERTADSSSGESPLSARATWSAAPSESSQAAVVHSASILAALWLAGATPRCPTVPRLGRPTPPPPLSPLASKTCLVASLKLCGSLNHAASRRIRSRCRAVSLAEGPSSSTSRARSSCARFILPTTCSMVSALRLTLSRTSATMLPWSTRVFMSCIPVSGPKRISFSCGYCEIQPSSAPRSTMPISISKTMLGLPGAVAYCIATSRSKVVDMKAVSTPPQAPCSSGSQKSSGSTPPAKPRYTLSTLVSLLALTITLLMTWVVVTYLLPLQPSRASPEPRRLTLYLTYIGPV